MKRLAALAAIPLVAGCTYQANVHFSNSPTVNGSGNMKTEARSVGAFSSIRLEGVAGVKVTVGPPTSVQVQADDNLLPLVLTEVQGNVLVIGERKSFSTKKGVVVTVTNPELAGIEQAGAGAFEVSGLKGKEFRLNSSGVGAVSLNGSAEQMDVSTSGAAGVALSQLDAKQLTVRIRGVGGVTASGKAERVEGTLSGTGALDAFDLAAKDAKVSVSGIGGARVNASNSVDASVSGIGGITYRGKPALVKTHVDGLGAVVPE